MEIKAHDGNQGIQGIIGPRGEVVSGTTTFSENKLTAAATSPTTITIAGMDAHNLVESNGLYIRSGSDFVLAFAFDNAPDNYTVGGVNVNALAGNDTIALTGTGSIDEIRFMTVTP